MFSGNTRNLPYIRDYTNAKKWWDEHPKPPRSRKWEDHQRPLYNTASRHYRLESTNPDEYIDVVLYQTTMARYYKPTPDGKQRRLYMGDSTITSRGFMCDVLGVLPWHNTASTPDGGKVIAPIYCRSFMSDGGEAFSADFMFDANNRLLVDESRHTKHWRRVSNESDKAKRAHIRELFRPYLDLALFRMSEFEANVDIDSRAGEPFSGYDSWSDNAGVSNMYIAMRNNELPTHDDIDKFFEVARSAFNTLASKRAYNQDDFVMNDWVAKQRGMPVSTYADLKKPITGADLRKALETKVLKICGADNKTGHLPIPPFPHPEDYPCGNLLVGENP